MSRIDETRPFIPVRIAVLTVSDTRTQKTDKSGPLLVSMIKEAGHEVAEHAIVEDDPKAIRKQVKRWIKDPASRRGDHHGRHGLHRTRRDAGSGEAAVREGDRRLLGAVPHAELREGRHLDGAIARLRRRGERAPIFSACRGRRGLAEDAWDGILKSQLDNRHRPCSFVEIMPRLEEHRKKKTKTAG